MSTSEEETKRQALNEMKRVLRDAFFKVNSTLYYQMMRELQYWAEKEADKLEEDLL